MFDKQSTRMSWLFIFTDASSSEINGFLKWNVLILFQLVNPQTLPVRAVTSQLFFYLPLNTWMFWSKSSTFYVAMLLVSSVILDPNTLLPCLLIKNIRV